MLVFFVINIFLHSCMSHLQNNNRSLHASSNIALLKSNDLICKWLGKTILMKIVTFCCTDISSMNNNFLLNKQTMSDYSWPLQLWLKCSDEMDLFIYVVLLKHKKCNCCITSVKKSIECWMDEASCLKLNTKFLKLSWNIGLQMIHGKYYVWNIGFRLSKLFLGINTGL